MRLRLQTPRLARTAPWNAAGSGAAETAKRWGMSKRRVLQLCLSGKVYAAKMVKGKWTIPTNALRPPDGRPYRKMCIPKHLAIILRYADATRRDVPKEMRKRSKKALDYFIRGSAFHLHTLKTSRLTFGDVCEVLAGRAVGGKPLHEQMDVVYHQRAVMFMVQALRQGRRLSVLLVQQLHGLIACGDQFHREPMRERARVDECVRRVRTLWLHPIHLAADFLVRFLVLAPYDKQVECTAYMVANFILMSNGYPPVVIYRRVFKWWRVRYMNLPPGHSERETKLVEEYSEVLDGTDWDGDELTPEDRTIKQAHTPVDPTIFVYIFAKAIHRSCNLGLMGAIPKFGSLSSL